MLLLNVPGREEVRFFWLKHQLTTPPRLPCARSLRVWLEGVQVIDMLPSIISGGHRTALLAQASPRPCVCSRAACRDACLLNSTLNANWP